MKTLKEYITRKYVENSYRNVILKQDTPIISMFLKVGEDFGIGDGHSFSKTKTYYWNEDELYFYNQLTSKGTKEVAYVDYLASKRRSVYTDRQGNLFLMNYLTQDIEPTTIDSIEDKERKERYLKYMAKLNNKNKKDENVDIKYTFLGKNNDKKYYYGTDEKYYVDDSNMSKNEIKDDVEAKMYCDGVLAQLKKMSI